MPKPKPTAPPSSGLSVYQRFEYREIPRAALKNATYNPRQISDVARKRLARSLETHGLVEPIVWNETTGNIVSGHQRTSILDDLEQRQDYRLGVAVVRLDEAQERALNVVLNNKAAQGEWDDAALLAMLHDPQLPIALADVGFTQADLLAEFGEAAATPEVDEIARQAGKTKDSAATMRTKRKAYDASAVDPEDDAEYYLVLAFRSAEDKAACLRHLHRPERTRHLSADELLGYLEPQWRWRRE